MVRSVLFLGLCSACSPLTPSAGSDAPVVEPEERAWYGQNCLRPAPDPARQPADPIHTGVSEEAPPGEAGEQEGAGRLPSPRCLATPHPLEDIQREAWSCLVLADGPNNEVDVWAVGLVSGGVALVGRFSEPPLGGRVRHDVSGLARVGDDLAWVAWHEGHYRAIVLSLTDGRIRVGGPFAATPWQLSAQGDEVFALGPTEPLVHYRGVEALLAGAGEVTAARPWASRLAVAGGEVHGLWHVADHVDRVDIATGEDLPDVPLEDWDTWVHGASIAQGVLVLSDDPNRQEHALGQRIASFDQRTGKRLGTVYLPHQSSTVAYPSEIAGLRSRGLWCEAGPGAGRP